MTFTAQRHLAPTSLPLLFFGILAAVCSASAQPWDLHRTIWSQAVPLRDAESIDRTAASQTIQAEADRLYAVLDADEVPKKVLLSGLAQYSDASKNAVVARVGRAFVPPPKGALLARLLFIRTPENEASMRTAFLANLRSPYAEARKFSLLGLKQLGHEALLDLALLSLRDDADQVLAVALDLLLPTAKTNRSLWTLLQGFYATHKGQEAFHMSVGLLEAHGIASR